MPRKAAPETPPAKPAPRPALYCACGCGTLTTNYYRHFIAGKYFWFHAPCYEQQLRREARDRAD